MRALRCAVVASFLSATAIVSAQPVTVLATGLDHPMKLTLTRRGNLLVAENGVEKNSGRVSLVDRSGKRRTIIDGLPSGLSSPNNDPDGVSGMEVRDRTLYIVIGEGDAIRPGTKPGTQVPNPDGVSSPILSSVLRLRLDSEIDRLSGAFRLKPEHHWTLADGNIVNLTSDAGDKATIEVFTDFRDSVPDPNTIYRNSHPFGIAFTPASPNVAFVVDAGQNALWVVNTATGRQRLLTRFAPLKAIAPGPPFIDAVPTSVRMWEGQLLVTLLTGFPFAPTQSRVMTVDPRTGASSLFIVGLNSAIDIAVRPTGTERPQFWVLEFSANQSARPPLPGRLLRYDTAQGSVVVNDLVTPTSMVLDPDTREIFISEMATGVIKQMKIQ
jgi:hypothetical protein